MAKRVKIKKRAEKKDFIYDNLKLGFLYMKKSQGYFLAAFLVMLLASLIGYFGIIGILSPELGKIIDNQVLKSIEEMIKETAGLGPFELTVFIMFNNIKTAFFGIISGFFFSIIPNLIIIFNGYVLGFVAEAAVSNPLNKEGIFILWRLLPHGIFEIPAILISVGIGIKIGLYPFYLKEKWRGFLSLLAAFLVFLFLSGAITFLLSLFASPYISTTDSFIQQNALDKLLVNPVFSLAYYLLMALSFIVSVLAGLKVLSLRDRSIVKGMLKNSFRVFVFIIIPLLVIAGLIEGLLIFLMG